jgi:HK97 family phage major capsid protein
MVKLAENHENKLQNVLNNSIELRSMNAFTDTNNVPVIPQQVSDKIFEIVSEIAPLYAQSQKFEGVGTISVPVEKAEPEDAELLAEGIASVPVDHEIDTVELKPKRLTASLSATNQLINGSTAGLETYFSNYLGRRIGNKLDNVILNGQSNSDKTPVDMLGVYKFVDGSASVQTAEAAQLADAVITEYASLKQEYINGAMWVMTRDMFDKLLHLKNTQGDYYLVQWSQAQGYVLLGLTIQISEHAKADSVLLINPAAALASFTSKDINIASVNNDSQTLLSDTTLFVACAHVHVAPVSLEPICLLNITEA